jgi:hypothetical protein
MADQLPKHLGGHMNKTHLDQGSLEYMIANYNIKTMLDIGCGPAGMVELARSLGIDAQGIDGDFKVNRPDVPVIIHDYEKGPSPLNIKVDLVWSCEFVEHVWEEFLPNFMKDFQRGKYVIMTYAPPGKQGHHHVNCNTEKYWIGIFKEYGFDYSPELTADIREVSTMGTRTNIAKPGKPPKWSISKTAFVHKHGLVFVKR